MRQRKVGKVKENKGRGSMVIAGGKVDEIRASGENESS